MECTNKCCKLKNKEAAIFIDFEMNTDLGVKRQNEYLCEKCAVNFLSYALAYRSNNKFKLHRYLSIDDYERLIDSFL